MRQQGYRQRPTRFFRLGTCVLAWCGVAALCVLALPAMAQPAWAPEWSIVVDAGHGEILTRHELVTEQIAADPNNGRIYLLGSEFLRLSATGQFEHLGLFSPGTWSGSNGLSWAKVRRDGDVMVAGDRNCWLMAYKPDGSLSWLWRPQSLWWCSVPVLSEDNSTYLATVRSISGGSSQVVIVRLLANGMEQVVRQWEVPGMPAPVLARHPGGQYLDIQLMHSSHTQVLRVTHQGQLLWSWETEGLWQFQMRPGSDDRILLLGRRNGDGAWKLIVLDRFGEQETQRSLLPEEGSSIRYAHLSSDRVMVVESTQARHRRVRALDHDLREVNRTERDSPFCVGWAIACGSWLDEDGDVVLMAGPGAEDTLIERYDSNAVLRFHHDFDAEPESDGDAFREVMLVGDGRLARVSQLRQHSGADVPVPTVQLLSRNGQASAVHALPVMRQPNTVQAPQSLTSPDGWTFIVISGEYSSLTALDPQGVQRWRQPLAFMFVQQETMTLAECGDGGIAVAWTDGAACYERADGRLRWRALEGQMRPGLQAQGMSNGNVIIHGSSNAWVLASADGRELGHSRVVGAMNPRHGMAYLRSDGSVWRLTPQGEDQELALPGTLEALGETRHLRRMHLDDHLGVTVIVYDQSQADGGLELSYVVDGTLRWQKSVGSDFLGPGWGGMEMNHLADGSILLHFTTIGSRALPTTGFERQVLLSIDPSSGEERWRRHLTPSSLKTQSVMGSYNGLILLAGARLSNDSLVLTVIDGSTGRWHREVAIPCIQPHCLPWDWTGLSRRIGIDGNGAVVLAGPMKTSLSLDVPVRKLTGLFGVTTALPVSQAALSGHWHPEYSSGQGFSATWFEHEREVFMPWFTYSDQVANDPAELRWYVLQGSVQAGTRTAVLPIYSVTDGQFDAPGSLSSQVGSARLHLDTCDTASLEYRFDPSHNSGAQGSIALGRTVPRGVECAEGNLIRPAEAAYDPALTAAWFDPHTDGQGLAIQRVAPSDGDPGFLFATWYTFDPLAPSGEAGDQHWFTLNEQVDPGDGVIRSRIYQSVSGRFDDLGTVNHTAIGEVELESVACDRLSMRYRFHDDDLAGAFRAIQGTIDLQRIGACP